MHSSPYSLSYHSSHLGQTLILMSLDHFASSEASLVQEYKLYLKWEGDLLKPRLVSNLLVVRDDLELLVLLSLTSRSWIAKAYYMLGKHSTNRAVPLAMGCTYGHGLYPWPQAVPLATGCTHGHRLYSWPRAVPMATGWTHGHRDPLLGLTFVSQHILMIQPYYCMPVVQYSIVQRFHDLSLCHHDGYLDCFLV